MKHKKDALLLGRRGLIFGLPVALLAGCGNPVGGDGAARIDARVDETLRFLYREYPHAQDLESNAAGMLVMPLITEAGFGIGGAHGKGALRIGGATVDYYSTTRANIGFQIGAQQYAHVLFFMTENALNQFRTARGWALGADAEIVVLDHGEAAAAETTTINSPVVALIFGQAGIRIGATIEGTKYSRIIP